MKEKIARTCYQFSEMIDDKFIEKKWKNLPETQKNKWYSCADAIMELKEA